jgi:hypothetical protein
MFGIFRVFHFTVYTSYCGHPFKPDIASTKNLMHQNIIYRTSLSSLMELSIYICCRTWKSISFWISCKVDSVKNGRSTLETAMSISILILVNHAKSTSWNTSLSCTLHFSISKIDIVEHQLNLCHTLKEQVKCNADLQSQTSSKTFIHVKFKSSRKFRGVSYNISVYVLHT